jgi:serine protease AprX
MKTYFIIIITSIFAVNLFAENEKRVWIYFENKDFAQYKNLAKIARLTLSKKSVKRRLNKNVTPLFDITDLPVNSSYLDRLRNMGIIIYRKSKWFNAVSAYLNHVEIGAIQKLPWVKGISEVKYFHSKNRIDNEKNANVSGTLKVENNYGDSFNQNQMIGVTTLHEMGYSGQGVMIALFDTGFRWDHEALQNIKISAQRDFIQNDNTVSNQSGDLFNQDNHGTLVLGAIAGYMPGELLGPAYAAEYILAKTEDVGSETYAEEDNWVAAAEWADSLGADIISTSLGYFDYGDIHYSYSDMDGNTAITTRAADLAAKKGISVFASAGNEGNNEWYYITAPADGDSVIAVGAVRPDRSSWEGSSHGPSYDGRIKPDLMAQGVDVYTVYPSTVNRYIEVGGTSLSCPLAAGAGAILLSIDSTLSPMQLREILTSTATQSDHPDNDYGYGIINLYRAIQHEYIKDSVKNKILAKSAELVQNYPNPFNTSTEIKITLLQDQKISLKIFNVIGKEVRTIINNKEFDTNVYYFSWDGTDNVNRRVSSGIYLLILSGNLNKDYIKIVYLK